MAIIGVFLALIRCLAEVLRLQAYATGPLLYEQYKPFIFGALTAAVFLFAMNIAFFYLRYKVVILVAVLAIISLFILKFVYL